MYTGNDWPDLSVPETKKNGKCQPAQNIPRIMLAAGSPTRAESLGNAYPRQPISSPACTGVENTIATNMTNHGVSLNAGQAPVAMRYMIATASLIAAK